MTDWRGTAHVMVHDDTTAAAIYQGALVVGSNGQGFPVYDGAGILMRKGIDPDKTRGIPNAPTWDTANGAQSLVLVQGAGAVPMTMSWLAVPRAKNYRVAVATDAEMTHVINIATTTEPHYTMSEMPAGTHFWAQVRAVGPEGIVGQLAPTRAMRIVRYALPDAAFVARDGVVVMHPGQSLPLFDADGLEMAYEDQRGWGARAVPSLYWTKLTGALRLPEGSFTRVVHLRDPELGTEAQIGIAPNQLRAEVQLAPNDAHAGDPVDVRVLVRDPSGRVDVVNENVAVAASIDLTPTRVLWQRAGNLVSGRIGTAQKGSPSVVRVLVEDGRGSEIGRGFLEIDAAQAQAQR